MLPTLGMREKQERCSDRLAGLVDLDTSQGGEAEPESSSAIALCSPEARIGVLHGSETLHSPRTSWSIPLVPLFPLPSGINEWCLIFFFSNSSLDTLMQSWPFNLPSNPEHALESSYFSFLVKH